MNLNFTTLRIRHILILYGSCDQKGNLIPKTKKCMKFNFSFKKDINPLYHCTCLNLSVHYRGCTAVLKSCQFLLQDFQDFWLTAALEGILRQFLDYARRLH